MQILGQFNLGFIIARLADDIFIIDQVVTPYLSTDISGILLHDHHILIFQFLLYDHNIQVFQILPLDHNIHM